MNQSASLVKTLKRVCRKCKSPFEYQAHVTARGKLFRRRICDACRAAHKRRLDRERKRTVVAPIRNRSQWEGRTNPWEFTSRRLIARDLGISPGMVVDLERSALHKLRTSAELQAAFRLYRKKGMPELKELARVLKVSASELLLEYQLEVGDFWEVYERLEAEGLREEAQTVLENIIQCQQAIGRQLQAVEL